MNSCIPKGFVPLRFYYQLWPDICYWQLWSENVVVTAVTKTLHVALPTQVCEMKNCTKCIFFEMKKKKDLYLWISNIPSGPSAKFLVENGTMHNWIACFNKLPYSAHHGWAETDWELPAGISATTLLWQCQYAEILNLLGWNLVGHFFKIWLDILWLVYPYYDEVVMKMTLH